MAPGDLKIWRAWLEAHGDEYSQFYYDVEIRMDIELPPDTPANMVEMWARSNAKRIDVVAEQLDTLTLIEVRVNAGASAYGALHTYMSLWQQAPPDPRPIKGVIVTDNPDPALLVVAAASGYDVEVIPRAVG